MEKYYKIALANKSEIRIIKIIATLRQTQLLWFRTNQRKTLLTLCKKDLKKVLDKANQKSKMLKALSE